MSRPLGALDLMVLGEVMPVRTKDGDFCLFGSVWNRDEENLLAWLLEKLDDFGPFLGLSFEGFEETLELL